MSKKNRKQIKEAVALKYSPFEDKAPKIVAAGKGEIAEKIIEKAEESNVPICKDTELAHALSALNIGDEIPPELYDVVAEILIFIDSLDRKYTKEVMCNEIE
ncbi:MAG TPA: flagellar biogenesis protein [Clostridiaceae bacterium]|nr:flagellar biogenesis protein [Clostridiaceae bacterium]